MRKILSILLLALFGLPLVSPLFAQGVDAERSLPACCRRGAVHGCARPRVAEDRQAVGESCRYHHSPDASVLPLAGGVAVPARLAVALGIASRLGWFQDRALLTRSERLGSRGPPQVA